MKLELPNQNFIEFQVHGVRNKIPVIYCVGFGESKDDLHNLEFVRNISKDFFVVSFDYRNTGKSSGSIENLKTSEMVSDLNSLLDYCKVKFSDKNWNDVAIVGWSHGSIVALIFSSKKKVKNLILIGYDGFFEHESDFSKAWKKLGILPDLKSFQKGKLLPNRRLPIKYGYHIDLMKYNKRDIIPKSKAEHVLILQGSEDEFNKTKRDFLLLKQNYKVKKI